MNEGLKMIKVENVWVVGSPVEDFKEVQKSLDKVLLKNENAAFKSPLE